MKFNHSDTLVYGKNRAKIDLSGYLLPLDLGEKVEYIEDATILVDLMSLSELKRYEELSPDARKRVADTIAKEKIVEVVGYSSYTVDFDYGVAGLPSFITDSIFVRSASLVANMIDSFSEEIEEVTIYDQMSAVISNYLNIPFTEVSQYPVKEVVRLYAICFRSFPNLMDLRPEDPLDEDL